MLFSVVAVPIYIPSVAPKVFLFFTSWPALYLLSSLWGFSGGPGVKNPPANARDAGDMGLIPGKIPWSRK